MCDTENYDFRKIDDNNKAFQELNERDVKQKMTSSMGSVLNDDDTPTQDSGVQLLDSETDLNDSMISSSGLEFEGTEATKFVPDTLPDLLVPLASKNALSKSDIENNNEQNTQESTQPDICNADMMSSIHSTFDTENTEIVYRRKIKKQSKAAPKKRVSFHEDILNSTRTDNIHIEHGFITYKGKQHKPNARYSWSEYNNEELDNFEKNVSPTGHHVYRNACSEVLDYGKTEIQDEDEKETAKYDKSGVFEYPPLNAKRFYRCNCSSSSSIESGSSSENNSNNSSNDSKASTDEKCNYKQAKSSSCDCIESTQQNGIEIGKGTCYFSEPNIGRSVWNKEKKPKTSCLKKNRRSEVVQESLPAESNVKKFNIHQISSSVIKDNGKMIIGSLKDILGISLPERGVPEGSEDAPEAQELTQSPKKDFSFLHKVGLFSPNQDNLQKFSKSLDGGLGKQNKNFVHNVDEQLRRANEEDLYAPSASNSRKSSLRTDSSVEEKEADEDLTTSYGNARNKFIINCESTVFEHTGTVEIANVRSSNEDDSCSSIVSQNIQIPFKSKISSIFNSLAGNVPNKAGNTDDEDKSTEEILDNNQMESSVTSISSDRNSSIISDVSSNNNHNNFDAKIASNKKPRHIASPLKTYRRMSPDLFNRDIPQSKNILSDEFDDILTISTDKTLDSTDIVIVDYSDVKNDIESNPNASSYYLKLPSIMTSSAASTSSKSSLINRFLRNVTQKKILEASIKRNTFFQAKLKNETKLFGGNLYVKGVKPKNEEMIKDMNAEIDMEVEIGCNSLDFEECEESKSNRSSLAYDDTGIGELKIDFFKSKTLPLFRERCETLMKAFKLYTGYSCEGHMCAVLVFLTDRTIYVVELVRNELCNKFVLPYAELDVILMGPMGNTVLLSNTARDMQQVLLTCGPYPAELVISNLEMCARRGGFHLPAVGQLTLDHFAPLQAFVCNNSSVSKCDIWKYYSIVNIPAGMLGVEDEPLGPTLQGFFMHRNLSHVGVVQKWSAGYFMLKAGVLYLFNDSTQKIPSWAVSLPNECQGARRCTTSNRPHCFEILLRTGSLQLAAPDEYVCSEWLQSVVQSANQFFDMNERPKILGCTLIMTENHLITLREDFSSPLRRVSHQTPAIMSPSPSLLKENIDPNLTRKMSNSTILDTSSEVSSIRSTASTPSRGCRSISTMCSTPTKYSRKKCYDESQSHTNMTSFYGKNSGIEVLTCAAIEELTTVKVPADEDNWWCLLEFSCQEVRENFDDLVLFFSTCSDMQRFLSMLESLWHKKMDEVFPISFSTENDCPQQKHCEKLFAEMKRSWDPLLEAALKISK